MDVLGTLLLVTPGGATQRALGQTLEKLGWRVLIVEALTGVAPTLEQQASAPDAICVMPGSSETLDDIMLLLEQCRSQQPKMLRVLADAPPSPPAETLIAWLNRARPHHYLPAPLDLWKLQHALQETLGERTVSEDERQVLAAYRRRREQKHIADTTIEVVTRPDGVRVIVPSPRLALWERPEAVPPPPPATAGPLRRSRCPGVGSGSCGPRGGCSPPTFRVRRHGLPRPIVCPLRGGRGIIPPRHQRARPLGRTRRSTAPAPPHPPGRSGCAFLVSPGSVSVCYRNPAVTGEPTAGS